MCAFIPIQVKIGKSMLNFMFNPNQARVGGIHPPPLDVSRDNFVEIIFFEHRAFATIFF